jgi:hypothetical protein
MLHIQLPYNRDNFKFLVSCKRPYAEGERQQSQTKLQNPKLSPPSMFWSGMTLWLVANAQLVMSQYHMKNRECPITKTLSRGIARSDGLNSSFARLVFKRL